MPDACGCFSVNQGQKFNSLLSFQSGFNSFRFDNATPIGSYLDYFSFVTPDFEPKPIYLEVQRYALGVEKAEPSDPAK